MKRRLLAFPFSLLLLSAANPPASAQIATWSGATNGDWNTGTNWVLGGAPNGVSSDAIFNSAGLNQSSLSLSAATSIRSMYLYGGNYTLGGAFTLNLGTGGAGFAQLGSGTWTVNNNITTSGNMFFNGTGSGAITLNGTINNGANTFDKWNESDVTLTNAYTTTSVSTSALRIRAGSLILSRAGSITQGAAAEITIGAASTFASGAFHNNANAALILDNTGTNNTNRITDTNRINLSARSLIEFRGNASAASSETLGILNMGGPGDRIRVDNGTGQSANLTFASLQANGGLNDSNTNTNTNPTLMTYLVNSGDTLGVAGTTGGRVIFTTAPTLTNSVLKYSVVKTATDVNFATYDATVDNGAALGVKELVSYNATDINVVTLTTNADVSGNATLTAARAANALRITSTGAGQSLGGNFNLTVQNAGGLIFKGTNDYSIGGTGTLNFGSSSAGYAYIDTNTLTVSKAVSFGGDFSKAGDGMLVISGNVSAPGSRQIGVDDGASADDMQISGILLDAGSSLQKTGLGVLALTGSGDNSTFTKGVSLNGGTIVLDKSSGTLQNSALGTGAIGMNGGTLAARNTAVTLSNRVDLTQQGSGANASNFAGNQAITFTGTAQGALNSAQNYIVANNGTADLTFSGVMQGFNANNASGVNSTIEFNGTGTTIVSGVIRNTDPTFANAATMTTGLNKSGSGLLILQNANTYTGFLPSSSLFSTGIQGGYLRADAAGALGTGALLISEANYSFGMNAVLELGTGNTTFSRNLGSSGANTVSLGSTSGNSPNNGGFASVTGTSLVQLNGGTAAVTWGGTGFFSSGGNLLLGSPNVTGTVDFQNAIVLNGSRTIRSINGAAAIDGILSGAITAAPSGNTTNLTFDGDGGIDVTGVISSAASNGSTGTTLIKNGTGTVVLSNNNTYTGTNTNALPANGTRITAGTLGIKSDLALGLTGGGAFQQILFTGSGTLQDTANNISLSAFRTIGINTGAVATFDSNGNTFTINGIIQNNSGNTASGIAKSGAGTVLLTGTNTYSGITAINAGTLSVQNGNAITDGSAVTIANVSGATLNIATGETIGSLAGGGATGGAVTLNANGLALGGDNTSTSFGGTISGNGVANSVGLVKQGSGTFTLTRANTYTQDTYAVGGRLAFSGGGNVNSSIIRLGETSGSNTATLSITDAAGGNSVASTIVVRAGSSGTKTISATNTSGISTFIGSVFLDANVTATSTTSGGTLAFTGSQLDLKTKNLLVNGAGNTTLSNVISNTGGSATTGTLQKAGAGTLVLSGANTFTGQVALDAGTIRVDTTPSSTGGTVFVGNGGTAGTAGSLLLGGAGGTGGGVTISNLIAINAGSSNNRTLGGVNSSGTTNTFSGTTFTNGGDLTITSTNAGASLAFTNASAIDLKGQNVLIDGSGNTQFLGAIYNSTGSGNVSIQGSGTATFSAVNTYTGVTTISAGTLSLTGIGELLNSTAVSITGGTLLLSTTEKVNLGANFTTGGGATVRLNPSVTFMETVGSLSLTSGTSIIDFGTNSVGNNVLSFTGPSNLNAGTLQVWNWSGNVGSGGGTDQLFFTNLSPTNASSVEFFSGSGPASNTSLGNGTLLGSGELVPVPEASSLLAALALVGAVFRRDGRSRQLKR